MRSTKNNHFVRLWAFPLKPGLLYMYLAYLPVVNHVLIISNVYHNQNHVHFHSDSWGPGTGGQLLPIFLISVSNNFIKPFTRKILPLKNITLVSFHNWIRLIQGAMKHSIIRTAYAHKQSVGLQRCSPHILNWDLSRYVFFIIDWYMKEVKYFGI